MESILLFFRSFYFTLNKSLITQAKITYILAPTPYQLPYLLVDINYA